jgi:hypothetical protein
MSPSESDLRAALRDGEGGNVDAGRIILGAEAGLARRKSRLLTTAAVVGVLAVVGVGGGFLASSGGDTTSASGGEQASVAGGGSSANAYGSDTGGSANGGTGAGGNAVVPAGPLQGDRRVFAASTVAPSCPPSAADATANAAKTSDATGTRLFTTRVSAVLLCSYGRADLTGSLQPVPRPAPRVLRGAAANRLVASLQRAPTSKPTGMCPMVRSAASAPLLMIGLDADGRVAGTASTLLGTVCNVVVFSAGAPRYDWHPPADVGSVLSVAPPTASATNRVHPSPISS